MFKDRVLIENREQIIKVRKSHMNSNNHHHKTDNQKLPIKSQNIQRQSIDGGLEKDYQG